MYKQQPYQNPLAPSLPLHQQTPVGSKTEKESKNILSILFYLCFLRILFCSNALMH